MSAALFAKLIEQFDSFVIRNSVILETLQLMLASEWEEGGVKEPALSISLTLLSIPGSDSRRNWKREAIRGRNFPRCCIPVSTSGTFLLL